MISPLHVLFDICRQFLGKLFWKCDKARIREENAKVGNALTGYEARNKPYFAFQACGSLIFAL